MVTIIISIMLVAALFGFIFRDEKFSFSDSGAGIGVIVGIFVGVTLSDMIPAKFEEQIISFPLGNDTGSQTTFLETEIIEGEEYYVFYYYGKNGCLKQEKFLKKKALIESSHNIDMAKIEIRRYSCDENATINYFSLRKIPDPEVIIYLPNNP